jgi:Uma2 family endonuclease
MTTEPAPRLMTADDLLLLSEDDVLHELDEGRLVAIMPSGSLSSMVSAEVLTHINSFVRANRLGRCGDANWGFKPRSDPDTVRAPDVSFVRADRIPATGIPRGFWPGAPDLAIEVLSSTQSFAEMLRKVSDYLQWGTRLVWIIDPERRTALICHPDGPVAMLGADGVLDGEDVVPGFALPLADIWV